MLLSPIGRDGVGDGSLQCEFTFRGLFSRIIQPAHRLFVYRPFSPFWPFSLSREGVGRILCLHRVSLQEEQASRSGEREDSGHCGTIWTKVAIATEFKGAEEWRPMQIEAFFSPRDWLAQYS